MFQTWRLRQRWETQGPDISLSKSVSHWIDYYQQKLRDFWNWLFNSNNSSPSVNHSGSHLPTLLRFGGYAVLALGIVFLIIVIYRIVRRPATHFAVGQVLSRDQINLAMEAGDALAMNAGEWMDEAKRLADEQNFRAVYRVMYLALLSGLHTVGKIEHNRNRTNWTYVQTYRGPADEREAFSSLTALFDRAWYGRKIAAGTDLEVLRSQVTALTRPRTAV